MRLYAVELSENLIFMNSSCGSQYLANTDSQICECPVNPE